jgi:hypothetical protein
VLSGFVWPKIKTVGEFLEYNNEVPSTENFINDIKMDVKVIC